MRVAVELGRDRPLVAVAAGPHAPPRLADQDAGRPPLTGPAGLNGIPELVGLAGGRVDELVVVHPPHWSPTAVRTAAARFTRHATRVRARCAALAAAREVAARTAVPPGPLAVLQVGADGGHAGVLPDPMGSPGRRPAPPPRCLDHADPAAALIAAAAPWGSAQRLTGGVVLLRPVTGGEPVDDDVLLERLTDLIGEPPLVPTEQDTLAVLGALRPSARSEQAAPPPPRPLPLPSEELAADLFPCPPRRRSGALGPTCLAVGAAVLVGLIGSLTGVPETRPGPAPDVRPARLLAQYDYSVTVPVGWRHGGGHPPRRRTLLIPDGGTSAQLISIEQTPLGYDSAAERDRAIGELRSRYESARGLEGFTEAARFADRDVIGFRETRPSEGTRVDWYVLFDRDAQLSVGCRYAEADAAGTAAVGQACAEVVRSLRLR